MSCSCFNIFQDPLGVWRVTFLTSLSVVMWISRMVTADGLVGKTRPARVCRHRRIAWIDMARFMGTVWGSSLPHEPCYLGLTLDPLWPMILANSGWPRTHISPVNLVIWRWLETHISPMNLAIWRWFETHVSPVNLAIWRWLETHISPINLAIWRWLETLISPVNLAIWRWLETHISHVNLAILNWSGTRIGPVNLVPI